MAATADARPAGAAAAAAAPATVGGVGGIDGGAGSAGTSAGAMKPDSSSSAAAAAAASAAAAVEPAAGGADAGAARVFQWTEAPPSPAGAPAAPAVAFHVVLLGQAAIAWIGGVGGLGSAALGDVCAAVPTPFDSVPAGTVLLSAGEVGASTAVGGGAGGAVDPMMAMMMGGGGGGGGGGAAALMGDGGAQGMPSLGATDGAAVALARRLAKRTNMHWFVCGTIWEAEAGVPPPMQLQLREFAERALVTALRTRILPPEATAAGGTSNAATADAKR